MSDSGTSRALPHGWARGQLRDVLITIEAGKSFTCEPRPAEDDEWGIIKVSAMTWGSFQAGENKAVPAGKEINEKHEIRPGDILISRANTREYVGAPVLVRDCRPKLLLSDKSLRLVPGHEVDRRWLLYLLSSPQVRRHISDTATGTKDSMRNISQRALLDTPIDIPPIAEQHRIVDALEDHLSRLDNADRTLDTCRLRIRRLRDFAVQRIMDELSPCPEEHLEQLLREPLRNGHSAPATEAPDGVRTLTLTAVTTKNFADANTKITSADPARVSNLWLEPGDILVQRSNTPELVGSSALYTGEPNWAIFPDLLIRVRTNERVAPEFAALGLASPRIRAYFRSSAKGLAGSMPKIDQGVILRTKLPVPSPDVQLRAVEEAASYERQITRSLEQLTKTSTRSRHLRAALLRRAFEGRLVPQEPNDEPASALLARVAAERDATATPARRRASRRPRTTTAQQEFDV
ncbi:restriction endonuclease subunit S [Streptomyces sp. NPDC001130]